MAFKSCHQLLKTLFPTILIQESDRNYANLSSIFLSYGIGISILDAKELPLNGDILMSFTPSRDGLIPVELAQLNKPMVIYGPLHEDLEKFQFPIVHTNDAFELDHETVKFVVERAWSYKVKEFQNVLDEYWDNIKKKSFRDFNKLLKDIDVNEEEKSKFWPEIQKISKRLLKFLRDHVDSSKKFSIAIEKYMDDHPELECLYKGPLFGSAALKKLPSGAAEYAFVIWKDEGPLLLVFSRKKKMHFPEILEQELSIVAGLIYLFERDLQFPWQKIFNHIPVPFAVFDNEGDIHIHNREFTKIDLGTNEIQMARNEDLIEKAGQTIKISRTELNSEEGNYLLLTFLTIDNLVQLGHDSPKKDNVKDLGIIAGSLAHEINNPIAGILTAVAILEGDDGLSKDVLQEIEEIKKCALRSKDLIQIFLGLSKVNIGQEMRLNLEKVILQSLSLLRFRMVESGITIELKENNDLQNTEEFHIENSSVLSMVIYLLLNTIINDFAHKHLVHGGMKHELAHLLIQWNYSSSKLTFKLRNPPKLTSFSENKLFFHLLDLCKLEVIIGKEFIVLSKRSQ